MHHRSTLLSLFVVTLLLLLLIVVVFATFVAAATEDTKDQEIDLEDPDPNADGYVDLSAIYSIHYMEEGHPPSFERSMPWRRGTAKRCRPKGFVKNSTEHFNILKTRYRPERVCCWERKSDGIRGLIPEECCEGSREWARYDCEQMMKDMPVYLEWDEAQRSGKGGDAGCAPHYPGYKYDRYSDNDEEEIPRKDKDDEDK